MRKCIQLMKKILLALFLSFSIKNVVGQDLALVWAQPLNGTSNQTVTDIAIDAFGNYIVIGNFEGVMDLDPSANSVQVTSAGQNDVFIAKYNPDGFFMWEYHFGNTEQDFAWDLAVDVLGNIYVAGEVRGAIDFDNNSETPETTNTGTGGYGFLLKLSSGGGFVWNKQWEGTGGNINKIKQIALDSTGNIVVAGETQNGNLDLDPGAPLVEVDGNHRIFYEKLTASGNLVWAKTLVGYSTYDAIITELKLDPFNNIFINGYFQSILDFDPGAGTTEFNGNGPADGFIAKYNSTGDFVWVKTVFNSSGAVYFNDMDIDGNGNLIITGSYTYTTDFNPDAIEVYELSTSGFLPRAFLLKLNANGIFDWVLDLTSQVESTGNQVSFNSDNEIMVAGYYNNATPDLNPDPNNEYFATQFGAQDAFISKFDGTGNFIYANSIGSIGQDKYTVLKNIPNTSQYITGGIFEATIDLDPNVGVNNLTSTQVIDAFIALYSECSQQTVNAEAIGCGEYNWNGTYYTESGLYTQTLISSTGCDSIVNLDLMIASATSSSQTVFACNSYNILDQVLTASDDYVLITENQYGCDSLIFLTLTIDELPSLEIAESDNMLTCTSGESYQWYICSGKGETTIIEGANSNTYSPGVSGSYTVFVTNGSCEEYAPCFDFTYIGVDEWTMSELVLFPNPSTRSVNVRSTGLLQSKQMSIFDVSGRLVQQLKCNANTQTIDISELTAGVYIVQVPGHSSQVLVKE